jgi:outer membrane lipoprotein-sorting protein
MKRNRFVVAVSAVCLGFAVSATADEKADGAIKQLDQQFAKVTSYTAKTESTTDVEFGPGHTQKTQLAGTLEWMRDGEKARMRSDTKADTATAEGGTTTKTASTHTMVSDGEFLWVLTVEGDQKSVLKNRAPTAQESRPSAVFAQLGSYYDITLLPDAQVNGADCYVFELKMKPMEGVPPSGRQLVYYQKDNGLSVKSEAYDANGKLTASSVTSDIKLNPDISSARFKFEVPEGAQVSDMTVTQQPEAQPEQPKEEKEQKPEKEKGKEKGPKLPTWPKRP